MRESILTPDMAQAIIDRTRSLSPTKRAPLVEAAIPRFPPGGYVPHIPHAGPQQLFLTLDQHDEVFYGGAAGGGKSDALLMAALQYVDVPGYAALLLRRNFTELTQPGALMHRLALWLGKTDATPRGGGRSWVFPSGASINFGYVQHAKDVEQFASAEFQYIAVDELTRGWERESYEFLFSRLRGPDKDAMRTGLGASAWDGTTLAQVPLRMRSGSNPGGAGHGWVKELFVDEQTRRGIFVPAKLKDNPSLDRSAYEKSLSHLGPVERQRLLNGDWDIVSEGNMFRRDFFDIIEWEDVPLDRMIAWCRYWDLAATDPRYVTSSFQPDWTAGALLGISRSNEWYLGDMVRMQGRPAAVERVVKQTADLDVAPSDHRPALEPLIRLEQEGGSAGVNTIDHYKDEVLIGYPFEGDRPSGSKVERADPVSAAAEQHRFHLVRGPWNEAFIEEAELFPIAKKDQIDAVSGAHKILSAYVRKRRKRQASIHRPRRNVNPQY